MLASKGTRFLTGDTMCCFDCELMPKLQHIRVAGEVKTNQWQSVVGRKVAARLALAGHILAPGQGWAESCHLSC